ncbi:MAG: type II glyceraldehyde-3-phosphate dehydrogenase [Clostridia bacterium]|nr:type II glyceraldehyde-3-phosphate dehydrogenase [Clostridia bacterium]
MAARQRVRVGVNGYGVIGKRVADAIALQDDMELMGVADVAADWRVRAAVQKGYRLFAATAEAAGDMAAAGLPVAGTLDDLLAQVDVVVDCTPKKLGRANAGRYRAAGVKAVFQGGESHDLTGHSFVAQANYETALGRDMTRVVSCNTTSIVRTLTALKRAGLLARARGTLIRRAADPWESDREGIINTVVPHREIPSHQGPDARTVDPDLDVVTMAVRAAHNSSHLHVWHVDLTRPASREEVLDAFRAAPRIALVRAGDGIAALNHTLELMQDLGRPRGDMWEVALWEDTLTVAGQELFYLYQVYNQAIVVPETVDAIRALTGLETEGARSIEKTDRSLGVVKEFLPG